MTSKDLYDAACDYASENELDWSPQAIEIAVSTAIREARACCGPEYSDTPAQRRKLREPQNEKRLRTVLMRALGVRCPWLWLALTFVGIGAPPAVSLALFIVKQLIAE